MTLTFNEILEHTLEFEGGYVNHPEDPGGETNYGITRAVAFENGYRGSMRNIPMSLVRNIYKTRYWDAVRGDSLPPLVALSLFDFAVNSGVSRAIRMIQRLLKLTPDGIIGPKTMFAINTANERELAIALLDKRLAFLRRLRTWPTFGRGWQRRIDKIRSILLQK